MLAKHIVQYLLEISSNTEDFEDMLKLANEIHEELGSLKGGLSEEDNRHRYAILALKTRIENLQKKCDHVFDRETHKCYICEYLYPGDLDDL